MADSLINVNKSKFKLSVKIKTEPAVAQNKLWQKKV